MKILFVMRHSGYVRNFESTLRSLAERGHRVRLAFQMSDAGARLDPHDETGRLVDSLAGLSRTSAPSRPMDHWGSLVTRLRTTQDYLRYLEPSYRNAPKLRARAERNTVERVRRIAPTLARVPGGLGGLQVVLRSVEQAVPRSTEIEAFLKRRAPDVLLVTPLVEAGSPQADYLRSARALGIRTGLCVASWDNLTNKGRIRDVPDLVTVWNEAMRREAMELHGVPAERVVVTGAAAYDQWFEWQPSRTREAFCAEVGIPADRPYVLYVCSSKFIAPAEVPFVREWLGKLRSHADPRLRELGVVVRPHPQNARQWQAVDLGEHGRVAIWPRGGANPVDAEAKAAYYDSIYHSVAVMGVNTSALIESGIVGRPVYTWLADVFRETQEGTLHFHHLLHVNGGLLRVASSFEEHAAQLLGAVEAGEAERESEREQNRRFLEAFVRPYGLGEAATPRLVAAIEKLGKQPAPRPAVDPAWVPLIRNAIERTVLKETTPTVLDANADDADTAGLKAPDWAKNRVTDFFMSEAHGVDAASFASAHDRFAPAASNGLVHGDGLDTAARLARLTDQYMALLPNVPPTFHTTQTAWWTLTEVRARSLLRTYGSRLPRTGDILAAAENENEHRARWALGKLRALEAFLSLEYGAVLNRTDGADTARVVWQIGGDGGQLAYVLAQVHSPLTFVTVDHAEHLTSAAAYLSVALPHAVVRLVGEAPAAVDPTAGPELLFVPFGREAEAGITDAHVAVLPALCPGLNADEVGSTLAYTRELGCPFIYSPARVLRREKSPQLDVQDLLTRYYWPHVFEILQEKTRDALHAAAKRTRVSVRDYDPAHVIGWRRVAP